MKSSPLVSILINNCNYAAFLSRAIESALEQTYGRVEVVVVDDGSTDHSKEVIERYGNSVRPILKRNGGQASAFNAAFEASRGEIVCFLDSDDLFLPIKVERVVEALDRHAETEWCFHRLALRTPAQIARGEIPAAAEGKGLERDVRGLIRNGLVRKVAHLAPATSALAFRRSLLGSILPMPEAPSCLLNDNYVKYLALGMAKGVLLDQELAVQRMHGGNALTGRALLNDTQTRCSLLTGYWICRNFPEFSALGRHLFSAGFARVRRDERLLALHKNEIATHIESLKPASRATLWFTSFLRTMRDLSRGESKQSNWLRDPLGVARSMKGRPRYESRVQKRW